MLRKNHDDMELPEYKEQVKELLDLMGRAYALSTELEDKYYPLMTHLDFNEFEDYMWATMASINQECKMYIGRLHRLIEEGTEG